MRTILARLKEPSTLAALAALLGVFGLKVAPETLSSFVEVAAVIAGLAGVLLPERGQS